MGLSAFMSEVLKLASLVFYKRDQDEQDRDKERKKCKSKRQTQLWAALPVHQLTP